jgi:integrase
LAVTAGTGLRFGEISALWVGDVDLDRGTVRVNKAWKRNGEDDATETPGWAIPAVAGETHDAGSPPRASKDTAIPTDHHDSPSRGRAAP